ncbi:hypothetical protein ACQPU1_12010 [Clostridium paraputrificum]|uniref:hypothetical protein n=1 Tax=Clostridium paraputrificum TaxID=29363 RepID=UPI003D32A5EA
MVYEYEIGNNLSREDIGSMFSKSRTVKRFAAYTWFYHIFFLTISVGLYILLTFLINNHKWNNMNNIVIGMYIIYIFYRIYRRKYDLVGWIKNTEKRVKNKSLSIEVKDNVFRYMEDDICILLDKDTVDEILSYEEYTLIFIAFRKVKIIFFPIFIPNNIFSSEDILNKFISTIS